MYADMHLAGESLDGDILPRQTDFVSPAEVDNVFDDGFVVKGVSSRPADFRFNAGFQIEIGVQNWGEHYSQINCHPCQNDQEQTSNYSFSFSLI
jgi:hypothetical protein